MEGGLPFCVCPYSPLFCMLFEFVPHGGCLANSSARRAKCPQVQLTDMPEDSDRLNEEVMMAPTAAAFRLPNIRR